MDLERIVQDIIEGKIDTSCCPEIDEIVKRYRRGEVSLDDLKKIIIKKSEEVV